MARIVIAVSGDIWCNRSQVLEAIFLNKGARHFVFDLNSEGPSLAALGIVDTLIEASAAVGVPANKIWIDRWQNPVEHIPFKRARPPGLSHFFWLSECYSQTCPDPSAWRVPFGLFVGRATLERAMIMYDLYNRLPDQVLVSLMKNHGASSVLSQDFSAWIPTGACSKQVQKWLINPPVESITNHTVRDQYLGVTNTNASLIKHYDKFFVEIVCETYCAGDAFFPTEKTVRPISQGKPMVIFGPKDFLSRLKNLGFHTWSDVWDETYDNFSGLQRWLHMQQTMDEILRQKLFQQPILQSITKYNQKNLERLISKHRPQ